MPRQNAKRRKTINETDLLWDLQLYLEARREERDPVFLSKQIDLPFAPFPELQIRIDGDDFKIHSVLWDHDGKRFLVFLDEPFRGSALCFSARVALFRKEGWKEPTE
jgi:hypothetical protein